MGSSAVLVALWMRRLSYEVSGGANIFSRPSNSLQSLAVGVCSVPVPQGETAVRMESGGVGGRVANPDRLGSPSQKVQSPVADGGVQTCRLNLISFCGIIVLNADVYEQHPYILVLFVQMGQ